MRKQLPVEFLYQLFSLIIAAILIHSLYVSIVRPNASQVLQLQAIEMNSNPNYVPERSTYVVIRDFEQEACFILMLWAFALMAYKANLARQERHVLSLNLIPVAQGHQYSARRQSRICPPYPSIVDAPTGLSFTPARCSRHFIDFGPRATFRMSRPLFAPSANQNLIVSIQSSL